MSDRRERLLAMLSDGGFHSGEQLASRLGVRRSAIWKQLRFFEEAGLEFEAVRGRGYRLARPLELLQARVVQSALSGFMATPPGPVEVVFMTGSTNHDLLNRFRGIGLHGRALLAEHQTAGRGRGEHTWLSAPASGLCLSLGWCYPAYPTTLTGLSLAAGVAVAGALQEAGYQGVRLQWPNDIVVDGAKLGGILIESRGQVAGNCELVLGVGINVHLPAGLESRLERTVTGLARLAPGGETSRNVLAARLIARLAGMLSEFEGAGFAAFIERWRQLDYTRGQTAELILADRRMIGRVLDIDTSGQLLMSVNGRTRSFSSGELSLRLIP